MLWDKETAFDQFLYSHIGVPATHAQMVEQLRQISNDAELARMFSALKADAEYNQFARWYDEVLMCIPTDSINLIACERHEKLVLPPKKLSHEVMVRIGNIPSIDGIVDDAFFSDGLAQFGECFRSGAVNDLYCKIVNTESDLTCDSYEYFFRFLDAMYAYFIIQYCEQKPKLPLKNKVAITYGTSAHPDLLGVVHAGQWHLRPSGVTAENFYQHIERLS